MTKNKSLEEWRSAVCYVLKHEEEPGEQFDLMDQLYASMVEINPTMLANALNDINEEFRLCRSLSVFYLSMKYLMSQKSYLRSEMLLKKVYSSLVEKYGLYDQVIMELENIKREDYPPRLVREIMAAIECLPKLFGIFRDKLDIACLPILLAWIIVYPQETKEQVQYLTEFCKYIVKDVCQKGAIKEYNQSTATDLVVIIINRCSLNYPGNDNLYQVIDSLPGDIIRNFDQAEDIVVVNVDRIINAFNCLTNSAITQKVLHLIYAVSFGFRRDEDYFALNKLYK